MTLVIKEASQQAEAWLVETNTDLTEGRGYQVPLCICEKEATAIRKARRSYVMGTDAPVRKVQIYRIHGAWYGPINLLPSTPEDDRMQERHDVRRAILEKAKAAGLSDEEIEVLRRAE